MDRGQLPNNAVSTGYASYSKHQRFTISVRDAEVSRRRQRAAKRRNYKMTELFDEKSGAPWSVPAKSCDDFHVGGVAELIDWRDADETVSADDQQPGVARKRRGIAGDRDHQRHLRVRERARLLLGALTRRVEYHRIEACEFRRQQRPPEEVAHLCFDRLEARNG